MTNSSHTAHYHHIDSQDNELTLQVEFSYTPGDPGRYHGLPEDCYPAEAAEVEILSITLAEASTPDSRQYPTRYPQLFKACTHSGSLTQALSQLGVEQSTKMISLLEPLFSALNTGGFIGPEQHLVPVDISDLLSSDTIDSIEAACFEAIEQAIADQEPPQ